MHQLPILKPGDSVHIVAPASRCSDQHLLDIKTLLTSWQLNCIVADDIFGADLLCANTDENRFANLKNALLSNESKAVICARGGYGSLRLIPDLLKTTPPQVNKLFVGMSDITTLNLYLTQQWQWPVIHGALAVDKFSPESIAALKAVLFGHVKQVEFKGLPRNELAEKQKIIETEVTGGNLCLVAASIGTKWQIQTKNKIILLEEVSERGYRIDRMLEHLQQAGIFQEAAAVLLGDFFGGDEPDGSSLVKPVLERFAKQCGIPVIRIEGIGHGYVNMPIPLGTRAELKLGNEIELRCSL